MTISLQNNHELNVILVFGTTVCTRSYISSLQPAMRECADASLINLMIQFCLLLGITKSERNGH